MSKFAHCHPDMEDGLMWCQHFNGSWIAFPLSTKDNTQTKDSSEDEPNV